MKRSTKPRVTAFERTLKRALACDDRPIVVIVGMDPAYTGPSGLCVWRVGDAVPIGWFDGNVFASATTMWLGNTVARVCEPGTRALLAIESNAFGAGIARKLGRAAGCVEGLLVDLNAIPVNSVVDVSASAWRRSTDLHTVKGRDELKAAACELAERYSGSPTGMSHDAADALLLTRFVERRVREAQRG